MSLLWPFLLQIPKQITAAAAHRYARTYTFVYLKEIKRKKNKVLFSLYEAAQ